jgi:large subunit ribosomal protein L32
LAILKGTRRRLTTRAADGFNPQEEISTMAVPKRRMSRANTRSRRAQWKAERPNLVGVTVAGQQHKVPRRLLKAARLGLIDLDRR